MHARCPSRVLADICMFFYPINSVNIQLIHAKEQPPQVQRAILDSEVCGAQKLGLSPLCWSDGTGGTLYASHRQFSCYIILLNESL